MQPDSSNRALYELAAGIERRGLAHASRILLDVIAPLGFLASQTALLARPLIPYGRWRSYLSALADEGSWATLRRILTSDTC